MTVIVEDGTFPANANSYSSILEADTYFEFARPNALDWLELEDEVKEQSLRFATKLLDEECWLGLRARPATQSLAWPRSSVWDADRQRFFPLNEIPDFLKCALYELAVAFSREDRTLVAESAGGDGIKRGKVDVLEIEYFPNSADIASKAKPLIPEIVQKLIDPYIEGSSRGVVKLFRV